MPLYNFIKLLCNGELVYILRDQTKEIPSNAPECWNKIFEEYLSISKNSEVDYIRTLQDDIDKIGSKIFFVNAAIFSLYNKRDDELIKVLEESGYNVEAVDDMDRFYKSLDKIGSKVKSLQIELSIKSKELAEIGKSHLKTRVDEGYFAKVLMYLSKHQGYSIKSKDITVLEFVELQATVKQEIEWQHKK